MGILDKAKRELLYRKNLNLFKEKLGEKVANLIESQGFKVKVVSKGEKLDVLINSHSVYGGDAKSLVELQLQEFFRKPLHIFRDALFDFNKLSLPGEISVNYRKNLFKDITNQEYRKLFQYEIDLSKGYIPLLLIQGVGLGIHIERFLKDYFVHNLVIVDLPKFLKPSLYYLDWEEIFNYFNNEDRKLHIVLLPENYEEKHPNVYFLPVIRAIGDISPVLVHFALFFRHLNYSPPISLYEWIISSDIHTFDLTGFFDDELWSLQWSIEKIQRKIPILIKSDVISDVRSSAVVIGAGPSLDNSFGFLRRAKESSVLISCGSAITALEKVNIKPDIHVELERTKITYDCISEVSKDFLRDIFLITTNPVWTECFDLFERGGVVLKEYDSGSGFFDKNIPRTVNSGVTVTSLGVSIALLLGFREIYLVGVDLGTKIPELHHSKQTNYYKSDSFMSKLPAYEFDRITKANFGGQAYTNYYFWLTAQSISQNTIVYKDASIFNLSDGIYISGTIPLMIDELNLKSNVDKKLILDAIFSAFSKDYTFNIDSLFERISVCIQDIIDSITNTTVKDIKSLIDALSGIEKSISKHYSVAQLFAGDLRVAKVMVLGGVLEGGIAPPEAWDKFQLHTLRYFELCKSELMRLSHSIQHLNGAASTEQITL